MPMLDDLIAKRDALSEILYQHYLKDHDQECTKCSEMRGQLYDMNASIDILEGRSFGPMPIPKNETSLRLRFHMVIKKVTKAIPKLFLDGW